MTTPLTFPAIIPNTAEFGLDSNTQQMSSALNGSVQTLALPGDRWTANLTFNNLFDPKARIMRAFLASLRGQAGRFYLTPPAYRRAGTGTGTPLVKGASQTGSSLITDGWGTSHAGAVCAGDYFQVGSELKMVTADANSNSSGDVTILFVPPIRVSPADNAAIIITAPVCTMALADPKQARWSAQPTPIYNMTLACIEPLT
jgi:hypothetical protein